MCPNCKKPWEVLGGKEFCPTCGEFKAEYDAKQAKRRYVRVAIPNSDYHYEGEFGKRLHLVRNEAQND